MTISSGVLFSTVYAVGERVIAREGTYIWFVMLGVIMIGIAGMIKNIADQTPATNRVGQ